MENSIAFKYTSLVTGGGEWWGGDGRGSKVNHIFRIGERPVADNGT
jgi:hypothetical protein